MKIVEQNSIVKINKVFPNEYNPKNLKEDANEYKETIRKLKKSISEHGQIQPLKVREIEKGYEIVDGFHTWQAMKELGFKEIEIKNLGDISLDKAITTLLSVENIKNPVDKIDEAELIKRLKEEMNLKIEDIEKLTPYSVEELNEKIQLLDFDWEQFNQGKDEESGKPKVIIECENEIERDEIFDKIDSMGLNVKIQKK